MNYVNTTEPRVVKGESRGYYLISRHYRWALTEALRRGGGAPADYTIVLEDDMEVAPDFFSFMAAGRGMMRADATLMCVSAWNDNGQKGRVREPTRAFRTDFMPGLGWLVAADRWAEWEPRWPQGYWDDWLREPDQRRGRQCIAPEINRSRTFGKVGTSGGQFFGAWLATIQLNEQFVDWEARDLSRLGTPALFEADFAAAVRAAKDSTVAALTKAGGPVRIPYKDEAELVRICKRLKLMSSDIKAGVPRMAYKGVVHFRYEGTHDVYIAPQGYIKSL